MRPSPLFLATALAALSLVLLAQAIFLHDSDSRRLGERSRAESDRVQAEERLRQTEGLIEKAKANLQVERERVKTLTERLQFETARADESDLGRDKVNLELRDAHARLLNAYMGIAEMERELARVSRRDRNLGGSRRWGTTEQIEPKIDGTVLGISDKVNLILISVGGKENVQIGYRFTVYRDNKYISKLIVDKVEDGWAACSELTDFRVESVQQGDSVSTRVFE